MVEKEDLKPKEKREEKHCRFKYLFTNISNKTNK